MSWSASYPPRSRSRSPRPRPPYPDPSYPQEPHRADWDAYDRDRWANYERERAAYDYGRRGRSRSPGPEEGAVFRETLRYSLTLVFSSWSET